MSERRHPFILPFALVTAILAVSTSSIFIRFAQEQAPSLVIAALRLTFGRRSCWLPSPGCAIALS